MSLRVNLCGQVKGVTPAAVAKASLNRAVLLRKQKSQGLDTKPGELPMARVKRG
jgi:hypothetical protein